MSFLNKLVKYFGFLVEINGGDTFLGKKFNEYSVPNEPTSLLGKGSFGKVFRVELESGGRTVRAMKVIESDETVDNELSVLIRCDHENIVKYYDHFEVNYRGSNNHSSLCVIIEFCEVC